MASGKSTDAKGAAGGAKKKKNLSGVAWFSANQKKYAFSKKLSDLDSGFQKKTNKFITALKTAGARVDILTTRRSKTRAQIMRMAWDVATRKVDPDKARKISGVNIDWDHGDNKASIKAAKDLVSKKCFNIGYRPSLTSLHILGKAIDMKISWSGELKIKDTKGKEVVIKSKPANGTNKELHAVGKGYGVIKLVGDPNHWSINGH